MAFAPLCFLPSTSPAPLRVDVTGRFARFFAVWRGCLSSLRDSLLRRPCNAGLHLEPG